MNKKGFTTIELITSFTLASVIMLILFNVIIIMKDNMSSVNAKTNVLVNKDNLSYNINKRFKEKELSSITMCDEGDKCYEFKYSDDTSDKLVYSNTDKSITFNNYTFDIIDGITVEEPTITEHYDTMSSTTYNGYFIIHIPIKLDNKDYSIKINKHFNTDSVMVDVPKYEYDNEGNRYTLVEYLESTGTQYIDTGIYPKATTKVIFDFALTDISDYRVRNGWQSSGYQENFIWGYADSQFYSGVSDNTNYQFANIDLDTNRHIFYINSEMQKIDDNEYGTTVFTKKISIIKTLYLFATHVEWSGQPSDWCKEKVYSTKIYDNDTLVRDYIPVIDSSSRPCLFDKVEKKCYYNQGEGEFLYG